MKTEIAAPFLQEVAETVEEMEKETDPKSIIVSCDMIIACMRGLRRFADLELKQLAFTDGRDL